MTATFLDRARMDRITSQAREVHPARTVLTVLAAALFAAGWCAFKVFAVAWFAVTWCVIAVREGWRQARGTPGVPRNDI